MSNHEEEGSREEAFAPSGEGTGESAPESRDGPGELSCPVCERLIPRPAPSICPHCQAPIQTIVSLLRTADLALTEALRDIRSGDLERAESRLDVIRATSRRHRIKVEVIRAMLARLHGDPAGALAILNAVDESGEDIDRDLGELIEQVRTQSMLDQGALAACCEHYNFALFQARRGHFEEARKSLRKALEHVPHHAQSHALMGKVLMALDEEERAKYHLRRAMASDPSNPTAASLLARSAGGAVPRAYLRLVRRLRLSPALANSILVIVILAALALVALLARQG